MRATTWVCMALLLLAGGASIARAQDYHLEEFSNDSDTFEPTDRDPLNDPNLAGLPPVDWNDVRTGWLGVIEEEFVQDAGKPGPDPGAATTQYGIVQPDGGSGPYWSPSSFDIDCVKLCYNIDNYSDPLIPSNNNGIVDWWWTSAVTADGSNYLTETGIAGTANGDGTWTYSTTGGIPIATVPVGSWYELEVCYVQGGDGNLDAIHTVYDATGTVPLGTVTLTSLFQNPTNTTVGPYYSWFTNFEANTDVLFVDQFQVECTPVPEPGTLALAGMGAIGLVAVARGRRVRK